MKIGLLTYHAACNFGANLQAYSTVSYFRNRGYDVVFINYLPASLEKYYKGNTPEDQSTIHEDFRKEHFPMTRRCNDEKEVADVIREESIDAVIIGSDAVMQHHPLLSRIIFPCKRIISVYHPSRDKMCPNPFWGSFLDYLSKPVPVCFMSASSQNSAYKQLSRKEKAMLKRHLLRYSFISTRDDWSSKMVESITDGAIVPTVTPDPVFAFNYNVTSQPTEMEIREKYNLKRPYYLVSYHNSNVVSIEWLKRLEELANTKGIECVAFPFPQGVEFNHPFKKEINLPLSPTDWYALIKYSSGYIGHNMHPIVIALHNAVPCFSFDQYGIVKYRFFTNEKSSKIYHIMNEFGVGENRVSDIGVRKETPTPEFVISKLETFDIEHVKQHAATYLQKYVDMMQNIEANILRQ